ncbi:MAG: lipoyl synthase [Spirochaetales bacterium]|nr:lipoyl synthase [Spirochaetales bacterium]
MTAGNEPKPRSQTKPLRKPDWIRMDLLTNEAFNSVRREMDREGLHTVCQEARCPNIHECWGVHRTATYMILGEVCTRSCRFCAVKTGKPGPVDCREPEKVAHSVQTMKIRHAVITMVTRDDLPDGGAEILARTVEALHALQPAPTVEVLSSDFGGAESALEILVASRPEILSHNLETVRRLTPSVRSRADYDGSLAFLGRIKGFDPGAVTKSSLMLGLGETQDEVLAAMDDLRRYDVDILNLGQYLQPDRKQTAVVKYWHPDEFAALREEALARGFIHCESGPMVRSSYHAGDSVEAILARKHRS